MPMALRAAPTTASTPDLAPATQRLIKSLGRPAPARTAFAEARFMQVLTRPLVSSGELAWLGGDHLKRRVLQPRAETFSIADGQVTQTREGKSPRSFSLKRAPQLQGLLDSFVAVLSGNAAALARDFELSLDGPPAQSWVLAMVPRDSGVRSSVASIRIAGRGSVPRCLVMAEADGDLVFDLLGPLATKMPAKPTRAALAQLCTAP